ncbi:MAG: cytochrome c [Planctomycetes bacterium]|nr:cytochrome c [Planctomycetota bacterium]
MSTVSFRCLPVVLLLLLAACDTPAAPSSDSAAQQVERGGRVYAANCARCHGDGAQGSDEAPPLAGKGALPLAPRAGQKRTQPFHSALDIAQFATQAMPPKAEARAKLSEADYWAVLAFALRANAVELRAPVGPANAAAIVLHP